MFVTRSKYNALAARYQDVLAERDQARTDAADHLTASIRTAGRNTHLAEQLDAAQADNRRLTNRSATAWHTVELDEEVFVRHEGRIDRLTRGCARYRDELREQRRVVRQLTDQLMHAMGYTDAGLRVLGVDKDEAVKP